MFIVKPDIYYLRIPIKAESTRAINNVDRVESSFSSGRIFLVAQSDFSHRANHRAMNPATAKAYELFTNKRKKYFAIFVAVLI